MNFDFSDDQKLLRDQARKFLTDKCDRTVVRSGGVRPNMRLI